MLAFGLRFFLLYSFCSFVSANSRWLQEVAHSRKETGCTLRASCDVEERNGGPFLPVA
jgi:hypothetical protein